jgi:DnaJ-class molecular chaperone
MSPHLQALGLGSGANADEIKAAYRRESKRVHPDLNPGDPSAAERFSKLTEHYEQALADLERPQTQPFSSFFQFNMAVVREVTASLEQAYEGFSATTSVGGHDVRVQFPPKSGQGDMVRVTAPGGIVVQFVLTLSRHQHFSFRNRLDLDLVTRVDVVTLITGGSITVRHLGGVEGVTVRPMTNPGTVFRLPGCGFHHGIQTGDLYLRVEASLPEDAAMRERLIKAVSSESMI